MSPGALLLAVAATVAGMPQDRAPGPASGDDRIWARVTTTAGTVVEGFVRWDRNEGSWADVLDGYRELPEEYRLEAERLGAEQRERSVEAFGVRVTWEEDPDWPGTAESGVRFGHVRSLTVTGDDRALVELRSGERVELTGGSTDLGPELRGLEVDDGRGGRTELAWEDLETMELGPAPPGRRPSAARLHGTLEDQGGRRYTGWVAWDLDEILTSDLLQGDEGEDGPRREIPFGEISAIRREGREAARVTLRDGRELVLGGTNDVDDGNRGIEVSDPALGHVRVPWQAFRSVRFHPPAGGGAAWDDFDGGHRLRGTVRTEEGAEHTGLVRWDNHEARSWEILDGRLEYVDLDVELGKVARIEKLSPGGARVTLRDGRTFELEGPNDVNEDNKGIFVAPDDGETVMVTWRDFREVVFRHPAGAPAATLLAPRVSAAQTVEVGAGDAYLDPVARELHQAARAEWERIEESVVRYTALVRQRFAAGIRTPLKDRTIYRSESAHRVFWDRDGEDIVQVLASREQTPAGVEEDDDEYYLDEAFDPAGDRLLFGMAERDEDEWGEPGDDDFWVEHPLRDDATTWYRFASGDTLTLSFPDGQRLQAVELRVIPRETDVHRIMGSLWVEPGSGALVRAVYRLADTFDAFRDIPDLQEEEDDDLRWIPGLFKPWTFELGMISVEYSLWEFEAWLPRGFRVEGVAGAGVLKAPATMEVSYRMESVVTEANLREEAAGQAPPDVMREMRFDSRAEAMAYLAELMGEEGVEYTVEEDGRGGGRLLVPTEPEVLRESPHLPPPVWEDAPGFPTGSELDDLADRLEDIPIPSTPASWAAHWGLQRPGLVRFNRVEGPAVGARVELRTGSPLGPLSLSLEPFLGLADLEPKARLSATRETLSRRVSLGAYRELRTVDRRGRHLGLGNSLGALLWGRDDGEYFTASGFDLTLTPPSAERETWNLRLWAERHEDVDVETDFSLTHAFEDGWTFRPNVEAEEREEVGAELTLSPWWGSDPLAPQLGLELYGQTARGLDGAGSYSRASLHVRGAVPFAVLGRDLRAAVEVGGGRSWGAPPAQRGWYLGSVHTLRGYPASVLRGPTFARARAELGRRFPAAVVTLFSDAAWAGPEPEAFHYDDGLISAGVGVSFLDGLLRLDLSRGLREPTDTRIDFYLDAVF